MRQFKEWMKIVSLPSIATALLIAVAAPAGVVGVAGISGCDSNDGPAEKAGRKIDEGMEETQDELDDATSD